MPLAGWFVLVLVFATVAVLAAYLIRVAVILNHVNFTVGTINAGVRAIAQGGEPLEPLIGEIYSNLEEARVALDQTLGVQG
ncbi:MAG TPA: hypothetical protein VM324_16910 [Egibacteraceae bacterium]|jgi:ABC-type multidrug transport system fused ATPase/permease subunit|nr:hypothetical protein [Egibacteraceae bacterium]